MAEWLPSLTGLVKLQIGYRCFRLPQRRPDRASERPPPPLTRAVLLPVLTTLSFKGGSEYLDHLFSHFDAPRLKHVDMDFVRPPTFAFSQISPLIGRRESFEAFDQAHMVWYDGFQEVDLRLSSRKGTTGCMWLKLSMSWTHKVWQLVSLTQVHHHPFALALATSGHFDFSQARERRYAILGLLIMERRRMARMFTPFLCCGEFVYLRENCDIRRTHSGGAHRRGK